MPKTCPFMSRNVVIPHHEVIKNRWGSHIDTTPTLQLVKVQCLGNDCQAWQPETYFCKMSPFCPRVDMAGCDVDTCTDAKKGEFTPGFCALIP
jgi:hypothetical protein